MGVGGSRKAITNIFNIVKPVNVEGGRLVISPSWDKTPVFMCMYLST